MIGKLRKKLIFIAMASLFGVLLLIMGAVAALNYWNVLSDADSTLTLLAQNGGAFPSTHQSETAPPHQQMPGENTPKLPPELPFETRYFYVTVDREGAVLNTNTGKIAAIDTQTAMEYARSVWNTGKERGFWGNYRYLQWDTPEGTLILFLDCWRSLSSFRTLILTCTLVSLGGFVLVFVLLVLLSGRMVRPFSESYEKQRRFITDAGHELKTPLTIIDADAEILTMDLGENEWVQEIQAQTKRLANLTHDLILLSRMEEAAPAQRTLCPLSQMAQDVVQSFEGVAMTHHQTLEAHIQPQLTLYGEESALQKLMTILLDNALKYMTPEGTAVFRLEQVKGHIRLTVTNPVEHMTRDQAARLFDRFYRTDASRNSQTGGYGLGLSIAQAITAAHRGKITAATPDGRSLTITVTFPKAP